VAGWGLGGFADRRHAGVDGRLVGDHPLVDQLAELAGLVVEPLHLGVEALAVGAALPPGQAAQERGVGGGGHAQVGGVGEERGEDVDGDQAPPLGMVPCRPPPRRADTVADASMRSTSHRRQLHARPLGHPDEGVAQVPIPPAGYQTPCRASTAGMQARVAGAR
jgi:hypothetical protein